MISIDYPTEFDYYTLRNRLSCIAEVGRHGGRYIEGHHRGIYSPFLYVMKSTSHAVIQR